MWDLHENILSRELLILFLDLYKETSNNQKMPSLLPINFSKSTLSQLNESSARSATTYTQHILQQFPELGSRYLFSHNKLIQASRELSDSLSNVDFHLLIIY
jgi:hypothetical protein